MWRDTVSAARRGWHRAGMPSRATHALRCDGCGDVIGVYEPAIVIQGEQIRETSVAAEPRRPPAWDRSFHAGCFDATSPTRVDP